MAEDLGLSDKERTFLIKWSAARTKGKVRYILTRGSVFGLLLFGIWLVATVVEINMSDYEMVLFTWESFRRRCIMWFILEMLIGFVIAFSSWKGKEEKYYYLSLLTEYYQKYRYYMYSRSKLFPITDSYIMNEERIAITAVEQSDIRRCGVCRQ